MPELPEVETICLGLEQQIIGKKIADIFTSDKNLRLPFPENFISDLKNQQILSVKRRARYILINISQSLTLLVHLGMSGKLTYQNSTTKSAKHDHCKINFTDGTCLIYNDPRRFGLIDLVKEEKIPAHKMIKNLGPEPLEGKFDAKYLHAVLQGKKINIKTAMMDNKIVVGVGNIYINESLFESRVSPLREAR